MPGIAFPPVGSVGLSSPPSQVLCFAKTALCPSPGASLVARALIPCLFRCVRGVPRGLVSWSKPPDHARAFDHPVPHSGNVTRRQMALPSSRVTPMKACPALRPRWCPTHSPFRGWDCCLPVPGNRRLSSRYSVESYPAVHDYTLFGVRSRGLHPRFVQLRTPIAGCARGLHSRPAGWALVRWDWHLLCAPTG
jgi:hypothetical protein